MHGRGLASCVPSPIKAGRVEGKAGGSSKASARHMGVAGSVKLARLKALPCFEIRTPDGFH